MNRRNFLKVMVSMLSFTYLPQGDMLSYDAMDRDFGVYESSFVIEGEAYEVLIEQNELRSAYVERIVEQFDRIRLERGFRSKVQDLRVHVYKAPLKTYPNWILISVFATWEPLKDAVFCLEYDTERKGYYLQARDLKLDPYICIEELLRAEIVKELERRRRK